MEKETATESIDFLTEKSEGHKLQTKCGPKLKLAVAARCQQLGIDESKYLRRVVVSDLNKSKLQ